MEQLAVNLTGQIRRATLHGREHIVVPMTMLVPGVLNGSKGPLLYVEEDIQQSVSKWNGMPIVLSHPHGDDGKPVSARDPDVLNKFGIGTVLRAKVHNGTLKAEGWFDVEQTKRVDGRLLDMLNSGNQIELSTGLFTDNEPAQNGATYNGREYVATAKNHSPDHLAVLLHERGACSISDGCGVNNQESFEEIREVLQQQLRDRFPSQPGYVDLWIVDVFPTYIIYSKDGQFYKLGYSGEGEDLTLSADQPLAVRRIVSYRPTTNEESSEEAVENACSECGPECGCESCQNGDYTGSKKKKKRKKEVVPVANAVANVNRMLTEMRAAWLKAHSDKSVEEMPKVLQINAKKGGGANCGIGAGGFQPGNKCASGGGGGGSSKSSAGVSSAVSQIDSAVLQGQAKRFKSGVADLEDATYKPGVGVKLKGALGTSDRKRLESVLSSSSLKRMSKSDLSVQDSVDVLKTILDDYKAHQTNNSESVNIANQLISEMRANWLRMHPKSSLEKIPKSFQIKPKSQAR